MEQKYYDLLLKYLSYKKYGKYSDFRRYVKDLIYEDCNVFCKDNYINDFIRHLRRTFSALGHVEFIFSDKPEYIVAPPVISILPNSSKGVLCGYRTEEFLNNIKNKCFQLGFEYAEENNYMAPKAIFIDFKTKDNISFCQNDTTILGKDIKIITDFSKKLLTIYPKINEIIGNIMQKVSPLDDIGYAQIYDEYKQHDFSNAGTKDYCVCEKIYFGLRKYYIYRNEDKEGYYESDKYTSIINQYLNYRPKIDIFELKNEKLIVKYIKGLPELIDRALTLASGKNRYKNNTVNRTNNSCLIYDNIDKELTELLTEKTGLEVKYD